MSQALALKYRPTRFKDLVGQDSISQTLSLALDHDRLGHAYLFSGLRGSGKTSSARIFAKALNCEKGISSTPCEQCESCIAAREGRHFDIIEMDAASRRGIDSIKELIEQTKYHPIAGRFKIFIIDEVHMLSTDAFNALLKTLEEPPSYIKFILATTDPLKIPATILSRTQHFHFKRIATQDIVMHIRWILEQEGIKAEPEAIDKIARSGEGSLRDTLTLLDQAIVYSGGDITTERVEKMLGLISAQLLDGFFEAIFTRDDSALRAVISELEGHELEMVLDEMAIFLHDKLMQNNPQYPFMVLDRFLRIIADSHILLSLNAHSSFILTLTSLKMREALKVGEIDKMIEELSHELAHGGVLKITEATTRGQAIENPRNERVENQVQKCVHTLANVEESHVQIARLNAYFEELKHKIYNRNYELGECFEKNVEFVSFEGGILTWSSQADGECRARLKDAYSVIRGFVQEIFGIDTIIKVAAPKPKTEETCVANAPKTSSETYAQAVAESVDSSLDSPFPKVEIKDENPVEQSLSQKQDGEFKNTPHTQEQLYEINEEDNDESVLQGGSGCVASMLDAPDELSREKRTEMILESPLVSAAKELLDVKKVIVRQKV
ncbi:MAG: DNA polymerase III subunit gamma/tau [Wolinella sp.]